MVFGMFKRRSDSALGAVGRMLYGENIPTEKASVQDAVQIAYKDILQERFGYDHIYNLVESLSKSGIPYRTYDLAVSVALNVLKDQTDRRDDLFDLQLSARIMVNNWSKDGRVSKILSDSFEHILYNRYKPVATSDNSASKKADRERLDKLRKGHENTSPQQLSRHFVSFLAMQYVNASEHRIRENDRDAEVFSRIEWAFTFGAMTGAIFLYGLKVDREGLFMQSVVGTYFGKGEDMIADLADAAIEFPDVAQVGATSAIEFIWQGPSKKNNKALAQVLATMKG